MTVQKQTDGSGDPQAPEDNNRTENHSGFQEPSLRPPDLHTLIRSRKESEKQLNLRFTLLQAIFDGADCAIFSVDTQSCYTSFNKKHARDIQDLYGSAITAGEKLAAFVPIEKDIQKILRLIRQAFLGEPGALSDYFGDNARSRRYFDLSCYPVRNDAGLITGAAVVATDTTSRKQNERHLVEQEERFRRLAEDSPDFLYRMTLPEGKYEYVSQGSFSFTGYTPEEFSQKPGLLYDLIHSSGKDAFGRQLELLIKGKTPPPAEFQVVHRNGDLRWGLIRSTLVRDTAGHPVAVEGVVTDITDGKKEQIALDETKEQFRTIFDSLDAGILLVDAETNVIAGANPRALEMIGATRETVIGAVCNRFIGPNEGCRCPVTDTEGVHESEGVIMTADGRSIPVLITVVPAKFSGRDLLIETFTDISEQKKTEDTLRQTEERYRELVEHSVDIICTINFSGEITSLNPAVLPLLGYRPDELLGENIGNYSKPESKQRVQEEIDRIKNGAQSDTVSEVEFQAKDGRFIPFDVNLRIRSDGHKNPDIVVTAHEISKRKKSEDALKESRERFRTLLQDMPSVAVLGFRPDYTVVFWNEAATSMSGYTAEEAMGKDIRDLLIPSDVRAEIAEICDHMALTGVPGPAAERDFLHKDGTRVPVFVGHAVVPVPEKSPILFCIGVDLSERKKAENAARDARHCLQSILDAAPFGTLVCELHDDGRLVCISENHSVTGIPGNDVSSRIGKTLEEAFPILASTNIPDACRKAARDGEPFHGEAFDQSTKEIPGVWEIHAVPLARNRISVFFRDISGQKKAREELEKSETRFRTLIRNSPDIIQILDQEKRLVYTSPAFTKILGYPEGDKNDCALLDIVHPDDRERVAAVLGEVSSCTTSGNPIEYRMLAADGTYQYVESAGMNLSGVPGVDGIVIHTHTVHERKQAEQALQKSEEQFRLIFQHSGDALYIFEITPSGMPGKIVDASDAAMLQTGYAKHELVQKTLTELCSRDLSHHSRGIMMELLTRGEARFETEKIRKDGTPLPVEISARLIKLKGRTYAIATSRDISRRKREDRALRIANQKLQLMNLVTWHDLLNKVNGLRGYVEHSKDLVMDEQLKKFIGGEEDVLRVIEQQIRYTGEYQELGIHPPQWVNIPQVLRSVISLRKTGLLEFRMDIPDLELFCDPVIGKVFSHLIENTQNHAEKATEIRISCNKTADSLVLVYEDNGVGIPGERKKDLFVPGAGSATGFTLFFIHDILEINDMNIQETGSPGTGVRFEISVPKGLYRIGRAGK